MEIEAALDQHLPAARFPILRARRRELVLVRKLVDLHVGRSGWRLYLDSDMLFFRRPDVLLEWLHRPSLPLHMVDVQNAYGYPLELLATLAGAPVPERVNTGIIGLDSATFDWERLESWARRLQETAGTSYFLDQALMAMSWPGTGTRRLRPPTMF